MRAGAAGDEGLAVLGQGREGAGGRAGVRLARVRRLRPASFTLAALVVIPLMTLLSVGAAALLDEHAAWLGLHPAHFADHRLGFRALSRSASQPGGAERAPVLPRPPFRAPR